MAKLNGENVSLHIQIDSLVQEHEKIKLEYQKLFNSIKMTRVQHQQEVNELIENVNQNTYAYGDVRAKNQDLLMTISELKATLKIAEKGKNVNTKFYKSVALVKLICVTPLNKNKYLKAKIVSKVEVKTDKSKPVTSCSIPKNEQGQKKDANVLARGMYRVMKTKTQMPVAKANLFSCNSTGVESSSSVRRPESKDTNSKKRILLNTKSKSTSKDDKKSQKKTVNVVRDGSNLVCVSCGKDVFMISHDKCVTCYALSLKSRVKRALFTSLVAAKSNRLGATPVVAKFRFSVATPPKATNKVSHATSLTPESRQSRALSTYMKNKIKTSRKWQKWFEHQSNFNWSPKSPTTQTPPSVSKSSTSPRTNSRTPLRASDTIFSQLDNFDGNLEVAFRSNTCYVRNLEGGDLLNGSRDSNLYTIFISEMAASSPVCLMSKATSTKSWLWHIRLSHLNFEYYAMRTPKVSDNFTANTLDNKDTLSSSSIIVEDHEVPQLVSSSEEPIANEPTTPVSDKHSDKQVQEDVAKLDGNTFMNPFGTFKFEEAKSSSNYHDP
ncbi:hypothetical protein Tco_0524037 [Tanacetum coccineum]